MCLVAESEIQAKTLKMNTKLLLMLGDMFANHCKRSSKKPKRKTINKPKVYIYARLTNQLISKENIMGKFKHAEVELNSEDGRDPVPLDSEDEMRYWCFQ